MEPSRLMWVVAVLLCASPVVYLSGHLFKRKALPLSQLTCVVSLIAAWVLFIQSIPVIQGSGPIFFSLGDISLCFDGLSLLLAAVVLSLGSMVVIFSIPYMSREMGQEKFYAMLTALMGVMIGLGCTNDLFNLWIWFEAMAVSSYLLVSFYHEQPASLEAGVKYLVQSAAGSVLVLIGISLVFSQTGTLSLSEIRTIDGANSIMVLAGVLFVLGFGVKTALVPLHTWLPDAHSQAPSGISAMLSGIVIEVGLVAMLRSLSSLSASNNWWGSLLMGFGVLNMLIGNLMALKQKQVKRLLAYSSLVHVGYMLVGLGIAIYLGQNSGAQGGLFHLFNHGMMKGLAFLAAGALIYSLYTCLGIHRPLTIDDLNGASRKYPLIAFTFSLSVLALGGIPPLSGFMSKWQILLAGVESQNAYLIALIVFAALNSVFSLVYYAPMVNAIYRREPSTAVLMGERTPLLINVPLFVLASLVILIGLWPSMLSWLTMPAGTHLLAAFGG